MTTWYSIRCDPLFQLYFDTALTKPFSGAFSVNSNIITGFYFYNGSNGSINSTSVLAPVTTIPRSYTILNDNVFTTSFSVNGCGLTSMLYKYDSTGTTVVKQYNLLHKLLSNAVGATNFDSLLGSSSTTYLQLNISPISNPLPLIPNPICFNKDTQILCLDLDTKQDIYISIQDLKENDLVKTYLHGYRKIAGIANKTMINDPTKPIKCMFKMLKTGNMTDDLILTGAHSILVDDMPEQIKDIHKRVTGLAQIDDKY
jgi:hypothetical protein